MEDCIFKEYNKYKDIFYSFGTYIRDDKILEYFFKLENLIKIEYQIYNSSLKNEYKEINIRSMTVHYNQFITLANRLSIEDHLFANVDRKINELESKIKNLDRKFNIETIN